MDIKEPLRYKVSLIDMKVTQAELYSRTHRVLVSYQDYQELRVLYDILKENSEASPQLFKRGQLVQVDNERYHGPGTVMYDTGDRKRVVGVLLGNGNIWEYDVATVSLPTA